MSVIFNKVITLIFFILFAYQGLYILISLFGKRKEEKKEISLHRFAVLICARNERKVIGELLESIGRQTYPKEYVQVYVMADNCDDDTAAIARDHGAAVYERKDTVRKGKGYALQELLEEVPDDYDACIVFDADNVLDPHYLEAMNQSFSQGHEIITGYRNSKNYDSNWISAGYSLWFLRENRFLNKARYLLGVSCAVSGTGFLFSREVLQNWDYHTLTEDLEFTVDQVCRGRRIAFCEDAVLYDEQPVLFMQSFHQRMRWAKGFLQVFLKDGGRLLKGVGRGNFSCFDMLNTLTSAYGLSVLTLIVNVLTLLGMILAEEPLVPFLMSLGKGLMRAYIGMYLIGLLTTLTEWKKIRTSSINKILYTFTFPLFMATYLPIAVCALFTEVQWTPIEHSISMRHENV